MLEVTWARILRRMARWEPPGRTSRATCQLCSQSPWIEVDSFRELPEDLRHYIFSELQAVVDRRYRQLVEEYAIDRDLDLDEEDDAERIERMTRLLGHAEEEMWNAIAHRVLDIESTRRRFVEPKLQGYLDDVLGELDERDVS